MTHTLTPAPDSVEYTAPTWNAFTNVIAGQAICGRFLAAYEPRTESHPMHTGLFKPIPAPAALPGQGETTSATKD